MKKVEAVIKRANYSSIVSGLSKMGYSIIDKRNLEDNSIFDKQIGSKAGSTGLRSIPLSKIELVVSDKDARTIINLISKRSGLASNPGKIFISEMEEVVDMDTLEGQKDLEKDEDLPLKKIRKRSRLVPLQKHTLRRIEKIYEENRDRLKSDYHIKSFSDFVNYCILSYLPTVENQLKHPTIIYDKGFSQY